MNKIAIIGPHHQNGWDVLQKMNFDVFEIKDLSKTNLIKELKEVEGIAVRTAVLDEEILSQCFKLKIVARHGVGYDNIDIGCLNERSIPLALAVGSNQVAVAEQAMLLILSLAKKIFEYDAAVRHGNFDFRETPISSNIDGKVMLIIGFGRTGRSLATRARAFGIKIYVVDPYVSWDSIIIIPSEP